MINYSKITPAEQATLNKIFYACATVQGIQAMYLLAEEVLTRRIKGDFVECGVFLGGLATAMALALQKHNEQRTFHLFDSWIGLPLGCVKDGNKQPGIGDMRHDPNLPLEQRLVSCGCNEATVEQVKANFNRFGLQTPFKFYPGWFQKTLPALAPDAITEIAVLHLDADLYESTLITLDYMYPKVVTGGLVVLDDYNLGGCREAFKDYFKGNPPEVSVEIDYGAAYFFKK